MDGDRIRYFRHTQKLSPKELSKLTGISRISIGYYERGDRSPKMDNLKLIAKALDIDIMKLVDEKAYISANFIGLRIRAERECKGLTQEHLVEKAGISKEALGNYERGFESPTYDVICKICKVLEMPVGLLVSDNATDNLEEILKPTQHEDAFLNYLQHISFSIKKQNESKRVIVQYTDTNEKVYLLSYGVLTQIESVTNLMVENLIAAFGEDMSELETRKG